MLLEQNDLVQKKLETEKSKEQCSSFSTSLMDSVKMLTLKLSLQQIELMFSIQPFFDQDDLIEKLSCQLLMKKQEQEFLKFTQELWQWIKKMWIMKN